MRERVKLLQAGDLHIGTAFSGSGFGVEKARRRRREVLGTFRLLCEAAQTYQVDGVLLTGDLFEAEWVSEAEAAEVRHLLGLLECPVLITPGNHDALLPGNPYSWGEWPANVHIFGPQVEAKRLPELGLTVHGYGYGQKWVRENPMRGYKVPDDGGLHVVMIHGSYESPEQTPYWPVSRDELLSLGADYVALGHYHQAQVLLDAGGLLQAAYAGSLEPLGFDETDEHGAFLLHVGRGGARVEWLALAQRAYRRLEIDLDGCSHLLEAADRIREAVPANWQGQDLVEAVLVGAVDPALQLDLQDLAERLADLAFHLRLTDRTHPDLDGDAYAPATAPGRFVAKMRERLAAEPDEAKRRLLERALVIGLHAYERGKAVTS
ncbi:metallophosphoesterase family protein [Tumebacillus flagellatus]|uniref:Calcineurin-like phosphoesterase domain-containing protein n=1 Tax=Tumebacillus flagellatus TaxID=1157490 RepID=A0A074LSI4_9BACL|nr:DNA repair exonuclease [Tumebacillus flagellatus]KEO84079.1 hypothetical protein EL26_06340 [Tumebacillus flagellatus]